MLFSLLAGLATGLLSGPANPMGALLNDFGTFKLHLAREQAGFIERCAAANFSRDTDINCGNTMSCFLDFLSEGFSDPLPDARNFSAALEGAYEDGARLREQVGAGPSPVDSYVPLLRTADGRRFLRRWAHAAVDRLRGELLKEEDLLEPRVFSLGMQWFQVNQARDLRAEALKDAVPGWVLDRLAAQEPDFVRPEPGSVDLTFLRQQVEIQVPGLVLEGRASFPQDPCAQRQAACVTFQWPNRKGGGLFQLELPQAELEQLCATLPAAAVAPGFAAWRGCTAVQLGVTPELALDQQKGQNHVLAVIKRPGPRFEVLQGYIASELERGYDLAEWICSSNQFADLRGFGPDTMAAFLGHMDVFVANSALGESGTAAFDGANHAATFLVTEAGFAGKPYLGTFWASEVEADAGGDSVLRQMVREVDGPPPKLAELCRDAGKIHGGKLLPGEHARAEHAAVGPAIVRTERW